MKKLKNTMKSTVFLSYLIFLVIILAISAAATLYTAMGSDEAPAPQEEQTTLKVLYENTQIIDFSEWNKNCDWNLVIINEKNPIFESFKPNLKPYFETTLDYRIIYYLEEMVRDAEAQGVKLWVSSGYRSFERQKNLFDAKVQDLIAQGCTPEVSTESAKKTIAEAGKSEHHLGLAVDLNGVKDDFFNSPEYNWLIENSANYGFILRYDKEKQSITGKSYEPWHFRYVGEKHAKKMKAKNLCLEEYVSQIIYQNS